MLAFAVVALIVILAFVPYGGEIGLVIFGIVMAVVAYRSVPGKPGT